MWKRLWNWLVGKDWKGVQEQTGERLEGAEHSIMGDAKTGSEGPAADRSEESGGRTDEGSSGNEGPIGKWSRGHPCYVVAKTLATLCPCPETPWEAELQHGGLVHLAEEISRQQSLQAAAWMLLAAVSQLCGEDPEQPGAEKKDLGSSRPGQGQQEENAVCSGQEKTTEKLLARVVSTSKREPCAPGRKSGKAFQSSSRQTLPLQSHQRPRSAYLFPKSFKAPPSRERAPGRSLDPSLPGPGRTPAGGRSGHHPCGAGAAGKQNARVPGSRQLPARFQREAWKPRQGREQGLEPLRGAVHGEALRGELQKRPQKGTRASSARHPPRKATSSVPGKPGRAADSSVRPQRAATRAKASRGVEARRPPPGFQRMFQANAEPRQRPATLQGASTKPRPSGSAQSELRHQVPSRAVPGGATKMRLRLSVQVK